MKPVWVIGSAPVAVTSQTSLEHKNDIQEQESMISENIDSYATCCLLVLKPEYE